MLPVMYARLRSFGAWLWHYTLWVAWHYAAWRLLWRNLVWPLYERHQRLMERWDHPLRRFLRKRTVLTLLAEGALAVSAGAAATVIGIAEVQIRSNRGGSDDIWNNMWVVIGLILGSVGFVWLLLAISSNGSQSQACREFPDLEIEIDEFVTAPEVTATVSQMPPRLERRGICVLNRETSRNASLEFTLLGDVECSRGTGVQSLPFFPPKAAKQPWNCPPGTRDRRVVSFDLRSRSCVVGSLRLEVIDHISRRRVSFPAALGTYDRRSWRDCDRLSSPPQAARRARTPAAPNPAHAWR